MEMIFDMGNPESTLDQKTTESLEEKITKEVHIVMGISGSGKSTFSRQLRREKGFPIIMPDYAELEILWYLMGRKVNIRTAHSLNLSVQYRRNYFGQNVRGNSRLAVEVAHDWYIYETTARAFDAMKHKGGVIIDGYFPERSVRIENIQLLRQLAQENGQSAVTTGYIMQHDDIEACYRRYVEREKRGDSLTNRYSKVTRVEITRWENFRLAAEYVLRQPPLIRDGFDNLFTVTLSSNGTYIVQQTEPKTASS